MAAPVKTPGYALAVIGIIVAAVGIIDHWQAIPVISWIGHGSVVTAAAGAVIFIIGAVLAMSGGKSAAKYFSRRLRDVVRQLQATSNISAVHQATGVNRHTIYRYRAWAQARGLLDPGQTLPPLEQLQRTPMLSCCQEGAKSHAGTPLGAEADCSYQHGLEE